MKKKKKKKETKVAMKCGREGVSIKQNENVLSLSRFVDSLSEGLFAQGYKRNTIQSSREERVLWIIQR